MTKAAYLEFEGMPLYFDCVTSETAEHTAEVTQHSVEQGADVADHVRVGLDRFTLEVLVSNHPIKDVNEMWGGNVMPLELDVKTFERPIPISPGGAARAVGELVDDLLGGGKVAWAGTTMQWPDHFDGPGFYLNALLDWQKRCAFGKVITGSRSYESMVITGVSSSRVPDIGDGMKIVIELQEIRMVQAQKVGVTMPAQPRGKKMVDKGHQPTTPASPAVEAKHEERSWAHALLY